VGCRPTPARWHTSVGDHGTSAAPGHGTLTAGFQIRERKLVRPTGPPVELMNTSSGDGYAFRCSVSNSISGTGTGTVRRPARLLGYGFWGDLTADLDEDPDDAQPPRVEIHGLPVEPDAFAPSGRRAPRSDAPTRRAAGRTRRVRCVGSGLTQSEKAQDHRTHLARWRDPGLRRCSDAPGDADIDHPAESPARH
jgi:hypothetical protein